MKDDKDGKTAETEPPMPIGILRPDFRFLDVEASGHHDSSYPIEVGWSDDALETDSFLIRPPPEWGTDDWLGEAQDVHGITREQLMDEGVSLQEAVARLNDLLADKFVFSDAPGFDLAWLRRLYVSADRRIAFGLHDETAAVAFHLEPKEEDIPALMKRYAEAFVLSEQIYPHTHRAAPDAMGMAATFRMTVDGDFFREVAAHHAILVLRGGA